MVQYCMQKEHARLHCMLTKEDLETHEVKCWSVEQVHIARIACGSDIVTCSVWVLENWNSYIEQLPCAKQVMSYGGGQQLSQPGSKTYIYNSRTKLYPANLQINIHIHACMENFVGLKTIVQADTMITHRERNTHRQIGRLDHTSALHIQCKTCSDYILRYMHVNW